MKLKITGNRTLNTRGFPKSITTFNNNANSLGVMVLPASGSTHAWDIPVNVTGARTLYTLMNNAWGVCWRQSQRERYATASHSSLLPSQWFLMT